MPNKFTFKQFVVLQDDSVFPVGTDACLLATLINDKNTENILEIGCGTGVVSLMLAQRIPRVRITAIDINKNATNLAQQNFINSPWRGNLTTEHISMGNYYRTSSQQFDRIITNPPFFKSSLLSNDYHMAIARHDLEFDFETFLGMGKSRLSENGRFAIILPQNRRMEYLDLLDKSKLHETSVTYIRPFENKPINRFVSEAGLNCATEINEEQEIYIYDKPSVYSSLVYRLFQPFYLRL